MLYNSYVQPHTHKKSIKRDSITLATKHVTITTIFKYMPSNNSHITLYTLRNPYSIPGTNTIMIGSAHADTHTHTLACAHTHMDKHTHTHTHTHTHMHAFTHTHACIHTHKHTHTHTYRGVSRQAEEGESFITALFSC